MSVGRINVGNMNKAQVIGGSVFTAGLLAFSVWTFGPLVALGATAPISPAVVTVIPEVTVTPTPTPTPTVAPVAPVVVVPAPVVEDPAPVVEAPAAPSGPDLCPAGTTSNGNDGVNDTSCMPLICYTVAIPDPAYPECDHFYPPSYYR